MGQEIVYCCKCSTRLTSSDFDKGKAFKVGDKSACAGCVRDFLGPLSLREQEAVLVKLRDVEARKSGSSAKLAAQRAQEDSGLQRRLTGDSTKVKRRVATEEGSNPAVIIGIVLGAVVLGLVALFVSLGDRPGPAPREARKAATPPEPPPRAAADPKPAREETGRAALDRARDYARQNPGDLAGQASRFKDAVWETEGTPLAAEARNEHEAVLRRQKEAVTADLAPLTQQARAACAKEDFKQAVNALEQGRAKHASAEWTQAVDAEIQRVNAEAWKAYIPVRDKAVEAKRKGLKDDLKVASDRVMGWGLPALISDFDKALRAVEVDAAGPAPPPPAPPASKEAEAYKSRWVAALRPLAARDFAAALRDLEQAAGTLQEPPLKAEAAADLQALKQAADLHAEALKALSKWPKGQSLRVEYLDARGAREAIEGPVQRADANAVEFAEIAVPVGEIVAGSLAAVAKAEPQTAVLFCLLEGDLEGARKHQGSPPVQVAEKYWTFARTRAGGLSDPESAAKEAAARQTFFAAESEFRAPRSRSAAFPKILALQAEQGQTAFVRRNRGLLAARVDAAREHLFLPADMAAAGTFIVTHQAKAGASWTCESDCPPAKAKNNFVEFEFFALPDTAYKAWVYAGACCQETFTVYVQGTDFTSPHPQNPKEMVPAEPGSNVSAPLKIPLLFLKKFHAQHGGPKEPAKWDWVPIPLPKYSSAGPKAVRLLAEQKGFSIAVAVVSATRKDEPRDAELKEWTHVDTAVAKEAPPPTGTILREWWTGVPGNKMDGLLRHPNFPAKPSGSGMLTSFEGPANFAEDYGARIRGYVHPPQTGAYVFWISSDDDSELYLSTDENPLNKRKIAWLEFAVKARDYETHASQKSAPITLSAGRRYYVEVLHKEGAREDHVSVGWQLPDGAKERPIPGSRLSPFAVGAAAAVPPAKAPPKLAFYRGINLNGAAATIDGNAWEGKTAADYSFKGAGFENTAVELAPPVDAARAGMIRSSVCEREGTSVTLYKVPNGPYQVALYVWEDNASQTFDLFLEGRQVVQKYTSGAAGHWEKLGPWTCEVTDGKLEVHASKGDANFSGIEVWRIVK